MTNSIAINALGNALSTSIGTFSAPNGIIQVGTQGILDQLNVDILGGNYVSKSLDIFAGTGTANISTNSISGLLNIEAGGLSLANNAGDLALGRLQLGVNSAGFNSAAFGAFSLASLESEEPPAWIENSNGDIIFLRDIEADSLVLTTKSSFLNSGASSFLLHSSMMLIAGENIDLTGTKSIVTDHPNGRVWLEAGGTLTLPDAKILAGAGTSVFISGGDLNMQGSVIDTSGNAGNPGRVFMASVDGSINMGSGGLITTGDTAPDTISLGLGEWFAVSVASKNALILGDVIAPGGEAVISSGSKTMKDAFGTWFTTTAFGSQGAGGITGGDISIRSDGSVQESRLIIQATNGDLNLKSVSGNGGILELSSPENIGIEHGVNNVSTGTKGGFVFVNFGEHISVPEGINNNSIAGAGGSIAIFGEAPQGINFGQDIVLSNTAATDGGRIDAGNTGGPIAITGSGIQVAANGNGAKLLFSTLKTDGNNTDITVNGELDASAGISGDGGWIFLTSEGDVHVGSNKLSASGAGEGKGGMISLGALGVLNVSGAMIEASGGNQGAGGSIGLNGSKIVLGNVTLNADGHGSGSGNGGGIFLTSDESISFSKNEVTMSARGVRGGGVFLRSRQDIFVDSSTFDVTALGGSGYLAGSGGTIDVYSQNGSISVVGDLRVDGARGGDGGWISLEAENPDSVVTIGTGNTKISAMGGADSSDNSVRPRGGTVLIRGGSAFINVKSIDVSGGKDGYGGDIGIRARQSLNLPNATLRADGNDTGGGGSINLTNGSTPFLVGAGGNVESLQARGGKVSGRGGSITIQSKGDLIVETKAIHVQPRGSEGNGGEVSLRAGAANEAGLMTYGNGALTLNGNLDVSGKGSGNGGTISLLAVAGGGAEGGGGPIGTFASLAHASTPGSLQVNGNLTANGGALGSGGRIELKAQTRLSDDGAAPLDQAQVTVGDASKSFAIRANGGTGGGDIDIYSNGSITVNATTVSASATEDGNGGNINVRLDAAPVGDDGGGVAVATFAANFTAEASEDSAAVANASFRANGVGAGNGGQVNLLAPDGSIQIHTEPQGSIIATSENGEGGTIKVEAGKNLGITGSISASGGSRGGVINLNSGGNLTIGAEGTYVRADSVKDGEGGEVNISATQNIAIQSSTVSARAHTVGKAGRIEISCLSGNLESKAILSASQIGSAGNAGTVKIIVPNGTVFVEGIRADAKGTGEGGHIFIDPVFIHIGLAGESATGAKGNGRIVHRATDFIRIDGPLKASFDDDGLIGGMVFLQAGGNIRTASIDVSGSAGPGGGVVILAHNNGGTSNPFIIGPDAGDNGVSGIINANGTVFAGGIWAPATPNGLFTYNFVVIEEGGTGGLVVQNADRIQLNTIGGHNYAGLLLSAPQGDLKIQGHLAVDGIGNFGAGRIILNSQKLDLGQNSTISASSSGSFAGRVEISAGEIIGRNISIGVHGKSDESTGQGSIVILPKGNITTNVNVVTEGGDNPRYFFGDIVATIIGSSGSLSFNGTNSMLIDATGPEKAGRVTIEGTTISFMQPVTVRANATTSDSFVNGNGGLIKIGNSSTILTNSHISLQSNGSGDGEAGQIAISAKNGTLRIAPDGAGFSFSALGGRSEASYENKVVNVSATIKNGELHIDGGSELSPAIAADAVLDHYGASLNFESEFRLAASGIVKVESPSGVGGTIYMKGGNLRLQNLELLQANGLAGGGEIIIVGTNGQSNVGGSIEATRLGDAAGAGGIISITNLGRLVLDANVRTTPFDSKTGHLGGTITVLATSIAHGQNEGGLAGDHVFITARAGNIGANANPVQTRAHQLRIHAESLQTGQVGNFGNAFIEQDGEVILEESSAVNTFSLTSTSGNILSNGGSIRASNVNLTARTGSIGTEVQQVHIGASKLNIHADNNGAGANQDVFVTANAFEDPNSSENFTSTRIKSSSSGSFSLQGIDVELVIDEIFSNKFFLSTGRKNVNVVGNRKITVLAGIGSDPLNQGSITSNNGNIFILSERDVHLNSAVITANGGTVNILGAGRSLQTAFDQTIDSVPSGDGTGPLTIQIGGTAGDVLVPQTIVVNGKQSNGLHITGNGNVLDAQNSLLIMNVNPAAGKIVLTSSVRINAWGTPLMPASMSFSPLRHVSEPKMQVNEDFTIVSYPEFFESVISPSGLEIKSGSCILKTKKDTKVSFLGGQAIIPRGSVFLFEQSRSSAKIRNLNANKAVVDIADRQFFVGAYQELHIGNHVNHEQLNDGISRRNARCVRNSEVECVLADFSPVSVLHSDPLLISLRKSSDPQHRKLFSRIEKVAAAVFAVTGTHGPYRR